MKAEFSQCAVGRRQSPIDIRDGITLDLDPVQFDYQPSAFSVIDNGHTVQVDVAPGNSIEANGRRYALQQFHFHRPSEERINGRQYEMDVHLVHRDADGRLAVVAVLLERGAAQPLLQTVWNNLPLEKHEAFAARARIDLNQLLPDRPALLHLHGLADHAAVHRGRAVAGDAAAGADVAAADRHLRAPVPDERAADPAGCGPHDQAV